MTKKHKETYYEQAMRIIREFINKQKEQQALKNIPTKFKP